MDILLPPHLEAFTRTLVDSGRFESPDAVIRASLELLREQEAETNELRRLIGEAFDDGRRVQVSREDVRAMLGARMAELRAKAERGEHPSPSETASPSR
jgi:putative addiction module CopG family antidote